MFLKGLISVTSFGNLNIILMTVKTVNDDDVLIARFEIRSDAPDWLIVWVT